MTENSQKKTISLVLPTTGKKNNLSQCLNSIIFNAPVSLLSRIELIVFLNPDPKYPIDNHELDAYLNSVKDFFKSFLMIKSEKFELSAEESAFFASAHATGDYVWLVGDKRIFLPEGLIQLEAWLDQPTAAGLYFNSVWFDHKGLTNAHAATHFTKMREFISYKSYVMQFGLNLMATNMGVWIIERRYLDRNIWREVIEHCGPHFSHVTTLLTTLKETQIACFATFLCQLEYKAYHSGDNSEWTRYAALAKKYRYYPWTFGLVRQFNYLIQKGIYSFADLRRSMCSESGLLRRQGDEIYSHLLAQLRLGWANPNERLSAEEFNEIMTLLNRAFPEKCIANKLINQLFNQYQSLSDKNFIQDFESIARACDIDHRPLRFGSLVIGQVGNQFIRLHPCGYLFSDLNDNTDFMLAYKVVNPFVSFDAFNSSKKWRILSQFDFDNFDLTIIPPSLESLFPVFLDLTKQAPLTRMKKIRSKIVTMLYHKKIIFKLVALLPGNIKQKLKEKLT